MEQYVITFDEIRALLAEQQYSDDDITELEKAFEFARKLHSGQYRVSEEPYIIHPMEVVKILVGLRADKHTLMAGFLHDILEDTERKPEEIKELFGEDVLNLVQGVTKLGKLQFKSTEERQAENFRRMLIAMASDVRIILLKLADNGMLTNIQNMLASKSYSYKSGIISNAFTIAAFGAVAFVVIAFVEKALDLTGVVWGYLPYVSIVGFTLAAVIYLVVKKIGQVKEKDAQVTGAV